MKTFSGFAALALSLVSLTSAQGPGGGSPGGGFSGGGSPDGGFSGVSPDAANCIADCADAVNGVTSTASGCQNATAIDAINSCIASSSCDDSDKQGLYDAVAKVCESAGTTLTAAPEASYTATTDSPLTGFTTYATGNGDNHNGGWGPGTAGAGPFGGVAGANGWGPFGSSGAWTSGPWTSWWGKNGCPSSTWSGWTSGPWGTNAPWTSWEGCTATTTGSTVETTTVTPTTGGTPSVVITTAFGIQVAAVTSLGSSGGTTTSTAAAGHGMTVAGAGVLLPACGAALLLL